MSAEKITPFPKPVANTPPPSQSTTVLNDPTRSLPWDSDAEKGVLSCFLHDPTNLLNDAQVNIPDEAFYHPANQLLYKVMKEFNNGTRPVEYIALTNYLRDAGQLDRIGGAGMLSELLNFVPTPAHYGYYKGILRDKHLLRRIIHACTESVSNAYEFNEDVPALLDRVEERIMNVRDDTESRDTIRPFKDRVMEAFDSIEEMLKHPGELRGLSTGYRPLDALSNGLQGSEMFVIAARPSMGKTSLVMNMVEHVAVNSGVPVAVFSLEMSAVMLVRRLIVARAGVSMSRIMNGMLSREEMRAVTRACSDLQQASILIDETPGLNILDFRAKCRRLKKQHNIGLIAIDYLQLMTAPTKKSDSRQNEIAAISAGIKAVAKELNVPVVVLAQLNRAVEQRKGQRPMLSDLRESGSIEQDADMVGLLTRADYAGSKQEIEGLDQKDIDEQEAANKGKAMLIIAKNRNGPTDDVPLKFIAELMRFTERDFDPSEKES